MFRFTPAPVSSASIFWWTGFNGFSTRGCVLGEWILFSTNSLILKRATFTDPTVDKWFDDRFPPLSIHQLVVLYLSTLREC